MLSDERIKEIGIDLYKGLIFTSLQVQNPSDIGMVFMPILLMDENQMAEFKELKPFVIFEYFDKAGPRSINGYPIFWSCCHATKEEWEKIYDIYSKMKRFEDEKYWRHLDKKKEEST
jgi:hypothetical protein